MTTINETLKSVLETGTGVTWYALEKPIANTLPAGVYTFIAERQVGSHSGDSNFRTVRVQLDCLASSIADLVTLVESVRTTLNWNTANWKVSYPLETRIETKEDNIYRSILEVYIQYAK